MVLMSHREPLLVKNMTKDQNKQKSNGKIPAYVLALLIIALMPLSAYSQMKTVKWKEEVRLTNGQMIIVERAQDYRYGYAGGGRPGWLFDYARIRGTFPPPNGEIAWEGRLAPLALDIASNGSIYLVAVLATVAGQKEYGMSDGSYHVAFNFMANNKWQRIPITAVPREFKPNMMAATHRFFIVDGSTVDFVDLPLKTKVDSDPRLVKKYRDWPRQ